MGARTDGGIVEGSTFPVGLGWRLGGVGSSDLTRTELTPGPEVTSVERLFSFSSVSASGFALALRLTTTRTFRFSGALPSGDPESFLCLISAVLGF